MFSNIFICTLLLLSCKNDDDTTNPNTIDIVGVTYSKSTKDFKTTDATIVNALELARPVGIVAQVNHSTNAASIEKKLDSTKVIFFGNPSLGTPLMQANQLVGLDLPQKLFIWKDPKNTVRVGFNNTSYLKARHGLKDSKALNTIHTALTNFTNTVGDTSFTSNNAESITKGEGIITKTSTKKFEETYNALLTAIKGNENLKLIAELNHQENAASVNMQLNPTRLIIFGNPNLGTPLMQNAQNTGIDLPQKFLVWEDNNGKVMVSYNDPVFLKSRHKITNNDNILTTIAGALDKLSTVATGL
ncbi:DUF302 domain-containing protein [Aquimarina longa]|uniref:DUF302 domain-containing protein n=1 Tax=Aquimarina longa TaxID=1080221 RepID=UPI001F082001|nr:DUF302 domain-containing protein [Aquimarina longa]